jgi:hypothetical protein
MRFKTLKDGCERKSNVLLALWNRAMWLDQALNAIDSNKKNVNPKLKQLVYMAQVYNQARAGLELKQC